MKKTKKLVIAALIVLFLLSTSISFVAAESKQAGKYTFQAEGYTIEYILPCDADFYAEKDSYGPLEWGALAFGWDLFRVFFDDAKEREMGALTVYHLNKSYWQEWQERIYWKQVSTFKDFDEFFEFIQEILFWMEARRTTASGHEVIILEGDYGEKIFWVQVDDDNIFVIDAERAICSSPYPPVYCPDPKLFWEIVDEFVQSFKVTAIEQLHTYYVNPGESIQDAVDTASDGDTIIVYPGTYTENVNVNKRLTIKSENGAEATIVQAADSDDHVFMVKAGFVNISGFTVKGATGNRRAGIYIDAYHCTISNNTASNNCCGILLYSTSNNTVTNNNASNNHNCGIELFSSGNNIIANNNANWNSDHPHGGICLRVSSNNNTVMNNNALNNSCGIHLADSSNNNITDNNASNNVQGILLYYSSNNNITNNNANMNDMCGVHLCDSSSNDIMNNNALNLGSGIHLADSSNNNIMNNNISDGFYLYSSSNNIVYRNNFINNTWRNVDSYKSTNIWNSPSKITYTYNGNTFTSYLGNYWDDYKDKYPGAKDKDNTGIWNTPYEIDGDNDYYPLVEWVENYFPGQEVPELCTIPDPPSHDFGEVPEGVQKSWRFNIVNSGSGTLEWEVSVNNPWISVNPSSGYTTTEQDPVEVTIDTSGLSGCNQGTLLITSNGGAKQGTIEVVVEVIRIVDNDRRLLKPNTKADPEYKYPEYAEVSIYTETVSEDELNIYVELNTINECVDKDTNETLLVDFGHGFEKGAITVLADEEATVLWDEAKLMVKGELKSQEDWPWNGAKTLGEVAYSGAPCKLMKAKKTIDPLVGVIYKGGGIVPAFYYKYIGEMPYTEWKPSYKWGSIVGGELGRKLLIEKLPVLGDLTSIQKILKGWAEEDAFARLLEQDPQEIFVPNYDEVTRSWAGIMAPDQWHICRFNSVVLIVPIKIKPDKTHSVAVRGKAYPYVFSGGKFLTFAKHFEVNPGKPLAQLTTAGEPYIAPGFAGDNIMLDESVMHKNNTRMKFTVFARSPEADPFTKYIFVEVSQFPEYGGIGPHFAEIKGGFASITVEETAQVPEDKIITDHLLDVWTYMTYDPPIAYENYNSKTYEAIPVIEEASAWEAVEFITTKLIALKCPQVAELIGLVFTVDDIIKYLDDCTTDFKVMRINEAEMDTFTDIWAGKERIIGTSEKYASVVTVFPIRFCSSVDNTIAVRSGVIVGSHEFLYSNVLEIPNGTKEVTCPCVADSWMMPSYPTVNNGQSGELWVLDNGVNTALGLVSFDLSAIPEDAVIHNAMVELYDHKYTKFKEDVAVYRILEPWGEMTVCYNNRPRFTSSPEGHVGPEPAGWISWDITPLTKQWVAGILPNYGLVLKPSLGTDRVFYSREAKGVEQRPRLIVEYSLSSKTIYVDDDFVVDEPSNHKWNTIQEGIKDANDGDTILVYPGTYTENVDVTKSLTIKSTSGNPEYTIVQAKDLYDAAFEVTADDVEISGFTVKGAGAGISLNRANQCNISNNIASNNDCYGIFLEYSDNNNITNNNASLNRGEGGIALHFSNENTLMNNDILNNGYGIELYHSNSNVLTNNIVKSNNEAGYFIGCIFLVHSSNNVFTNNSVLNNNGGIDLDSSSNYNSIYHNDFRDNGKSASDRSGTNSWDKGYPSGGNYWSDYKEKYPNAKEIDDTGIWNTPYEIPGDVGAKDNYPLVEPYLAPSKYLELAKYYAPVIYQDIDDSDPDADYITKFNYDNNWIGNDNWDNQDDGNYSLLPYVYYSVVETETHWFICYAIYHPRDWTDLKHFLDPEHENDMEGILEVIEKDDTEYGKFLCMVTVAHLDFFSFVKEGSGIEGGIEDLDGDEFIYFKECDPEGKNCGEHPIIYVESKGHAVYGSTGSFIWSPLPIKRWDEEGFPGGDGVIYYSGNRAEKPKTEKKEQCVHYELISINKLWEKRYNFSEGEPFANYGTFDGDCSGGCGSGRGKSCEEDKANAPWGYDDKDDGEVYAPDFFMDPAYLADFYFNGLYDEGQKESFHTYISRSYPVIVESFHPVKSGMAQLYYDRTWSWKVEGAKEISLHFKKIELSQEKHITPDHIEVWGKNVRKKQIIYGATDLDQGWTQPVDGDTIHLRLLANTETKTGESGSWGFCADRCESVMPLICVKGGNEDYQPLKVFFRGSSIHVNILKPLPPSVFTYTLMRRQPPEDEEIARKTPASYDFDMDMPSDAPIGEYYIKIEGTEIQSDDFYIIFNPKACCVSPEFSQTDLSDYWSSEYTGQIKGPWWVDPKYKTETSHYDPEVLEYGLSRAHDSKSPHEAIARIAGELFVDLNFKEGTEAPSDIKEIIQRINNGEKPDANCKVFSTTLVALCRATGIPSRKIYGGPRFPSHGWTECFHLCNNKVDWQVWDATRDPRFWDADYPGYLREIFGDSPPSTVIDELGKHREEDYKPQLAKEISASLSSPANLHAYDSQGNHVGVNTKGEIDLQIPNSYYTGPDSEPEEIIIFGQSENIKFKVEALEEGKFNLTITQSTEAETKKISYNDVPIAETTEATVDVSEANPTYIMEIDTNGDGTTDRKREPEPIGGDDTVPPELTIISPEEGQIYRMSEIPLEVSANEPVSKWSYSLNGAAPVTFTPNTWITAREGDNSLVVYAEDLAGNVGSSVVSFVVDTTPPEVICPADVTVELETLLGTVVPLEATATDNCDPNPIIASNELDIYPPGTTIVTFTATDASGNSASCSTNVAVVDRTPPVITNVMVSPTIVSSGTPISISANVFDIAKLSLVGAFITKEGEPVSTVFMLDPDGDGVYTGTWRTVNYTEPGIYSIDISARDTEGNEAFVKAPEVEITL